MASVDEILSIVACILFAVLLGGFTFRFIRSGWKVYAYIIFFLLLRIVAYAIRAYIGSGAVLPGDSNFLSFYITELVLLSIGVVFIMKLFTRLYDFILPKLRSQTGQEADLFERCLVERTRFFLLPLIAILIAGAVLSTDGKESDQTTGLLLRKIGICLLALLGAWYLFTAVNYRRQYPEHQKAFTIAVLAIGLFDISLVYKVVYTFYVKAETETVVFFIFSPLLELLALCVLSVDLQSYFLGHEHQDGSKALGGKVEYEHAPTEV